MSIHRRLVRWALLGLLALTAGTAGILAVEEEFTSTGTPPNHVIDIGGYDSIDLLNGNLHFENVLFAGQVNSGLRYEVKLAYNSAVWKWNANEGEMRLGSKSPLGLGFRLHMGRIYRIEDPDPGDLDKWYYEDPSGTAHRLKKDNDWGDEYYWSQDSTFLKAKKRLVSGQIVGWDLWIPDGTHLEMTHHVTIGSAYLPNWHGWYTTLISSPLQPAANWVLVAYDASHPACIQQIEDSLDRIITFSNVDSIDGHVINGGVTQSVTVPAFNGQSATYAFEYALADVSRPTNEPYTEPNELVLTRFVYPAGGFDRTFEYEMTGPLRVEGPVTRMTAGLGGAPPLSASIVYRYNVFTPNNNMGGDFQHQVDRRTLESAEGASYVWDYKRDSTLDGCTYVGPGRTVVDDPYGNQTRYVFSATESDPNDPDCDFACLSLVGGCSAPINGLLQRIKFYRGTEMNGVLLREERRTYNYDHSDPAILPGFGPSTRLKSTEVTFTEGQPRTRKTEYDEWDGFHWKVRKEFDFDGNLYRVHRTEFTVPDPNTPKWDNWVLNTFSSRALHEQECSIGQPPICSLSLKTQSNYSFLDDGRAYWRRDLIDPPNLSTQGDVLTTYGYDSDLNLAGMGTSDPETSAGERSVNSYFEYGHLKSSQFGASLQFPNVSWRAIDRDVDFATGLTRTSRDPNGVASVYEYDVLGRLEEVRPTIPELPTFVHNPSGTESITERGTAGTADHIWAKRRYDSLGRLVEERRLNEDGTEVKRIRQYEGPEPRISFLSEWVAAANPTPPGTVYSYDVGLLKDPFGRVQEVRLADDPNLHRTTYAYDGPDHVEMVHGINDDPAQVAVTAYETDAFGRLIRVTPPAGVAIAEYTYDVRDNLIRVDLREQQTPTRVVAGVSVGSPGALKQSRLRTYNPLNRMISRTEPETGTTTFLSYDPSGNLLEFEQPDGSIVRTTYDVASRPVVTTLDPPGAAGAAVVTDRLYDQSPLFGKSAGKLTTEKSYDESGALVVEKKFIYMGLNGRLSKITSKFPEWTRGTPPVQVQMGTQFAYDNLGRLKDLTYPNDANVPSTIVNQTYVHGMLTKVDSSNRGILVKELDWNAAGGLSRLKSGNDVETFYTPDLMNRPGRIEVKYGATTFLDTGGFKYDGAENIASLGAEDPVADSFTYDFGGRLVIASVSANGAAAGTYVLSQAYDNLGNITSMTKGLLGGTSMPTSTPVDPATNRMTLVNGVPIDYDENGNLEFDGSMVYDWDHRSRLKNVIHSGQTMGEYRYDSGSLRVYKKDNAAFRTTYQFRGPGGSLLSEHSKPSDSNLEPQWNRDYVYAAGRLAAVVQNAEPLEPSGISSSSSSSSVHLGWAQGTDLDLYGYNVYRSQTSGSGFVRLNTTSTITANSFDDTAPWFDGSGNGIPTYYVITTVDLAGNESRYSAERYIIPGDTTLPAPVQELAATSGDAMVSLMWAQNYEADLAGYDIYRSTTPSSSGGTFTRINLFPVVPTSFVDGDLINGTTYYYKVIAVDTAGNISSPSQEVASAPQAPGGGGGGGCQENCMPGQGEGAFLTPQPTTCSGEAFCPSPPRWIGRQSPGGSPWEVLFVHTDHLGSTRVVTDEFRQMVSRHHYFPFGEEMPTLSVPATSKRFTGHERDDESGLDYMMARSYSMSLARFQSPDPLLIPSASAPDSWNRYAYVQNNPTNYIDPDGLFSIPFLDRIQDMLYQYTMPVAQLFHGSSPELGLAPAASGTYVCNPMTTFGGTLGSPLEISTGLDGPGWSRTPPYYPDAGPTVPIGSPPPETGYTDEWRKIPNKQYDPSKPGSRPEKYVPPKGQPGGRGISWDPEGHWDVDDGSGERKRFLPDGTELDKDHKSLKVRIVVIGIGILIYEAIKWSAAAAAAPATGGGTLAVAGALP